MFVKHGNYLVNPAYITFIKVKEDTNTLVLTVIGEETKRLFRFDTLQQALDFLGELEKAM